MKISTMAAQAVFAASAFSTILPCSTMLPFSTILPDQSMPGMNMPAQPKPKNSPVHRHAVPAKKSGPALRKPAQQDKPMPGMDMSRQKDKSIAGDKSVPGEKPMPGMDMSQHEAQPGQPPRGTDMNNMQGMHTDGPMAQDGSVTHDSMNLQEPENPLHKTGSNMPAPDLLKEVVQRQPMSLREFLELADKTNPTLLQANAFVNRSAAQARQAGLYPNPSVGYQGEQIRGGDYGGGEQGAYVQQTIVTGGKLGLRRNLYTQQKQSDQIGVEEQTYRVHNDVTQAFYTALTLQATVIVRQRLLGLAMDAVETVHQLANVGQADSPDILQAEVEAEQAKIDFVIAQREFIQNFRTLAAFAGKRNIDVSPLAGSLEAIPELNADQQVEAIVNNSPTVRRMQQEVTIGEARLRDAKREPVPDLTVRAGEQHNFEHIATRTVGANGSQSVATGPQSFAQIGVNLPLWNRNQGNVGAAQAEIERARQDVIRTQLSLKQMAEPFAQTYLSSRFTAERYKTQLIPRAQRAYQLYLTKYQSMAMAYPQVLVSQRTLFQLQIGYLTALHDVWMNAIALENFTLKGGLDAPMSTGSTSTSINLPASGGSVE